MTTFQTQCPHCQHTFAITEQQLGLKNGLARCGNCKQIFSAKDNLLNLSVKQTPNPVATTQPVEAQPSNQLSSHQPTSQSLTSSINPLPIIDARDTVVISPAPQTKSAAREEDDLLFDDQSGLEDDPIVPMPAIHPTANQASNTQDFSFDILDDFENLASPTRTHSKNTPAEIKSTADTASPVEGFPAEKKSNNITSDDESWLNELLEKEAIAEQNQSYLASTKIDSQSSATDVSSLLSEFGVEVAEEKPLEQPEYQQRLDERLNHHPTAQQIAQQQPKSRTILWGIGSLLLLLGLLAQYVIFNQAAMVKNPETAQTLRGLCDGLHLPCNLPYADLNSLDIKTLSFEGKDTTSDVIFSLTNRSTQSQIYPNLKITLQSNNIGVAQMVVTPQQYLEDASRTLMPQQIKPIKLRINFPRNKADQVVIDPFY